MTATNSVTPPISGPVRRADVVATLATQPPAALRAILEAAGHVPESPNADALAAQVATALWWAYATPLGYALGQVTLDDIVYHVARKLGVAGIPEHGDAWDQVRALTRILATTTGSAASASPDQPGVGLDDLTATDRARLSPSWLPTAFAASGAATSLAAGAVGRGIVWVGATPIGKLLPYVPTVGPWWKTARTVAGAAAMVGSPLAIGLSVVALNQALGTNYRSLVPLLLGVGALGPAGVAHAQEI
jgi:hypothetical protein